MVMRTVLSMTVLLQFFDKPYDLKGDLCFT